MDVEVEGPHEARDGQLLIHLDLNCKAVLTLRLRNGGSQPVTLTHLFSLWWNSQFVFYDDKKELPCPLGPGEWISKGEEWWNYRGWGQLALGRSSLLEAFCRVVGCI